MSLSGTILKLFGWQVSITVPDYPKCIICVAPHTSNWDFILGELAYLSVGRRAGFLMKAAWFRWPLGYFFRAIGGIAVPKRRPGGPSLTEYVIERFRSSERLALAITPEGTRSRTANWHTGFLHIAAGAGVPIVLGVIDAAAKRIMIEKTFEPTGNVDADMATIKRFYAPFTGIHPEKFTVE